MRLHTAEPAGTADAEPVPYPFNEADGISLADAYEEAREQPGLLRVRMAYGEPAWLATRYADARLVLGDRRFSRAEGARHDEPRQSEGRRDSGILSMDPPDHTRLRTLVAKAFTMHQVEKLRPAVRELADELIDKMVATGAPVDLVEEFALPVPVGVICQLLGVPVEDRPRFRAWSDAALSTSSLTAEEFDANQEELRAYMRGLIEDHRARPREDLITGLIEARDRDDRLTEQELVDLCVGILVAGHETTATQIPNFVVTLLDRPEQWNRLREDPELVPTAVEELMRFVPLGSGASFPRYATEDVEVGGTLVRAGEPVLVAVGAANRDPARFDAPQELDLAREGNQHLGFGHGVHHCLGAPLARLELQEALGALLRRLPGLRIAGDIEWKTQMLVRGPRTLPVGW
ncbi:MULTISPECIES: cytochrome P450 [Streptomycetaceae]|uniref:Cytochrome P450 n=1 Tax=Streptantibioticus cattleyicolor (strain ATCC 35852 / DSM 46488 / JCM 4925 / NBRC 14057 / NRRL 8057) TaxID=1003195 RepID=F8JSU2_STREN|nr:MULTISPECIES: cytochrome P450 [Streptomycetaceae]AEW98000.1 cytochrome P450 [Streptantibioticus cattleyicolor NRRL 8057 = DSM 46488]MYS62400.1 cytochrome P450 [Streptomyces sp. SID5468]CCB78318.1 Cytochrome P450 107B1 [Streptantibioticus cattleyicolor NRRL 8057 = DSM 46488]